MTWLAIACFLLIGLSWFPCCCDDECTVACANCTTGLAPCEWQVEISGVVNDFCTGCSALNGTYIVPATSSGCLAEVFVSRFTTWSGVKKRSGGACVDLDINGKVVVRVVGGFDIYAIEVTLIFDTSDYTIIWRTSHPGDDSKVVCEVSALDVPWSTTTPAPFEDPPCDADTSTCTITALT